MACRASLLSRMQTSHSSSLGRQLQLAALAQKLQLVANKLASVCKGLQQLLFKVAREQRHAFSVQATTEHGAAAGCLHRTSALLS